MSTAQKWSLRPAGVDDAAALLQLIRSLAVYEHLEDEVVATVDGLGAALAGSAPSVEALLAEVSGEPVGFALFFPHFSTFRSAAGLYLEDLFVQPAWRGHGIGRALLAAVAARAVERGCSRLEWVVLDWNHPALAFYQRLGAQALDEWRRHRLSGEALMTLASGAAPM